MPLTNNNQYAILTGSLGSATQSDTIILGQGKFTAKVKGGSGTVKLERFDAEQNEWDTVFTWTAGTDDSVQNGEEFVGNASYRFNVTAYTSGTIKVTLKFAQY